MAYVKQTWVDGDPTKPVSAIRMNYIEEGIESAHEAIEDGGGGGTPSGAAGGVLSGTYPNPGFASDMATQAELDAVAAAKANTSHTHATTDVTGLQAGLNAKQNTSEKGQPNGYAPLNGSGRVPIANIASGTPDGTKFVRDDGTLATPAGSGGDFVTQEELAEAIANGVAPGSAPVYISKTQPSNPTLPSLWIPLNSDNSVKEIEDWQIFVPDPTPGIPLSNLAAWYSAPLVSGTNGQKISQWNDGSGNNHHLLQAVTAQQPTIVTNVQNSQQAIRFTTANTVQMLVTGLNIPQPFEIFLVFRVRTDANSQRTGLLKLGNPDPNFSWDSAASGGARQIIGNMGNWVDGGPATTAPLTWNVWNWRVNGASSQLFLGSALIAQGSVQNAGSSAIDRIGIGTFPTGDVDWGEIVITNGTLSSDNRTALVNHLTTTWGVA